MMSQCEMIVSEVTFFILKKLQELLISVSLMFDH